MTVVLKDLSKSWGKQVPDELVREIIRGVPYYYKGYKDVIAGTKKIEEIMGSSSMQAVLISVLAYFIKSRLDKTKYLLATNEAGLHLGHNNNLSTDLGIFLKEDVKLNIQYFQVAPEVAIEVDVRIDTEKDADYIFAKSSLLIEFGTKMVIWVMTKNKKIMILESGREMEIFDWSKDIELMKNSPNPSFTLNVQRILEEEGLEF